MDFSPDILWLIPAYLLLVNAATFLFYWVDKSQAKSGGHRISEGSLLLLAVAGGALAAILACHTLRHKTRKRPFLVALYLIALFEICLLGGALQQGHFRQVFPPKVEVQG